MQRTYWSRMIHPGGWLPGWLLSGWLVAGWLVAGWLATTWVEESRAGELTGSIVDAGSGRLLPARLYLRDQQGQYLHVESADTAGSAVAYQKQRDQSIEIHTTLSAHPFRAQLPPGTYTLTAERGKEYLPATAQIEIGDQPVRVELALQRWIDLAAQGWFSGDTHVHRSLQELPNAMLAEDLNVAFPLTYWVTRAYLPPEQGDKNENAPRVAAEVVRVDDTHVIYPLNTEYEIFTVDGQRHTLGAVFALNHRSVLTAGAPPVRPIAEQVHREGGLLELDKHNWPWSMMLVPVMEVDLYELTNNHLWRTGFHFTGFGEPAADYMKVETNQRGWTEQGWIDFTFQNYYALLNCGFRLRPTAGTASGVHPVPLGFGRVYVELPDGFSYDGWLKGLDAGRSFVTTGPLLMVRCNDQPTGHRFEQPAERRSYEVQGTAYSPQPLSRIELIVNGQLQEKLEPANEPRRQGGFESRFRWTVPVDQTSWWAVRCFQPDGTSTRFAHTAPFHVDVADRPLRPRGEELDYLIHRVRVQLERNRGVLEPEALAEYEAALAEFESRRVKQ